MQGAYQTCMEKLESEERYESWENMIRKDSTSFLQVVVQKYLQNKISYEKSAGSICDLERCDRRGRPFYCNVCGS